MGCHGCSQRYKGFTSHSAKRVRRGQRRDIRGNKVDEKRQVLDTPLVNKSDTVTPPETGPTIPATGMAVSVQKTGRDPTNFIAQPLPETVNPVIVDANKGVPGTSNASESQVIPTPGGS